MAVASLVLGLIALLGSPATSGFGGIVCGILAIIFGVSGRKEPAHRGMATAGLILGVISVFGGLIIALVVFGFLALLGLSAATL